MTKTLKEVLAVATPGPVTAKPFLTPEKDDDPMGVFIFEPCATETGKLYFDIDPDEDVDFDEKVHGRNAADAALFAHMRNTYEELVSALEEVCTYIHDEYSASHALCERVKDAEAVLAKAQEVEVPE